MTGMVIGRLRLTSDLEGAKGHAAHSTVCGLMCFQSSALRSQTGDSRGKFANIDVSPLFVHGEDVLMEIHSRSSSIKA